MTQQEKYQQAEAYLLDQGYVFAGDYYDDDNRLSFGLLFIKNSNGDQLKMWLNDRTLPLILEFADGVA
jgi:hypothetical protein